MDVITTDKRWFGPIAGFALAAMVGCGGDSDLIEYSPDSGLDSGDPGTRASDVVFVRRSESDGTTTLVRTHTLGQSSLELDSHDYLHTIEVSPEGTRVAYLRNGYVGESDLYIANLSGSADVMQLSDAPVGEGRIRNHQWSPDGLSLAYITDPDGNGDSEIHTVNADNASSTLLDQDAPKSGLVGFSSDGRRIAFVSDRHNVGFEELFTIAPNGSNLEKVNPPLAENGKIRNMAVGEYESAFVHDYIQWSPGGERIAYIADQDVFGQLELYSVRPDGTDFYRVNVDAGSDGEVSEFVWSPDGERILYEMNPDVDGMARLYVSRFDGTSAVEIAASRSDFMYRIMGLSWSPDGQWVAFQNNQRNEDEVDLYIARPDGSFRHRIEPPRTGSTITSYRWSGDSGYVAYSVKGDPMVYSEEEGMWLPDPSPLYTVDVDEFNVAEVNPPLERGGADSYKWSPDSERLSFLAREPETPETGRYHTVLYTVRPDGSDLAEIDTRPSSGHFSDIRWRADSKGILYRRIVGTDPVWDALFYASFDGALRRQLSPDPCEPGCVTDYELIH